MFRWGCNIEKLKMKTCRYHFKRKRGPNFSNTFLQCSTILGIYTPMPAATGPYNGKKEKTIGTYKKRPNVKQKSEAKGRSSRNSVAEMALDIVVDQNCKYIQRSTFSSTEISALGQ